MAQDTLTDEEEPTAPPQDDEQPQEAPPQQDPRLAKADSILATRKPAGTSDPRLAKVDSILASRRSAAAPAGGGDEPPPMPFAMGPDGHMVPKASLPPEQPGILERAWDAVRPVLTPKPTEAQREQYAPPKPPRAVDLRAAAPNALQKSRWDPDTDQPTVGPTPATPTAFPGLPGAPETGAQLRAKAPSLLEKTAVVPPGQAQGGVTPEEAAGITARAGDPNPDRVKNAFNTFAQSTGMRAGSIVQSGALWADQLKDLAAQHDGPPSQSRLAQAVYDAGTRLKYNAKAMFPEDPALQNDFLGHTLPASAAALANYMGITAVGGPYAATAAMMLESGADEYDAARNAGASHDDAMRAFRWGNAAGIPFGLLGAGEGIAAKVGAPRLILDALGHAEPGYIKASSAVPSVARGLAQAMAKGTVGGLELAVAQAVSQIGHNAIAQDIYQHDRSLGQGVMDAAAGGGVANFLTTALLHGVGMNVVPNTTEARGFKSTDWRFDEPEAEPQAEPAAPPPPPGGGSQGQEAPPRQGPRVTDPYAILGISRNASDDEVKAARNRLTKDLIAQGNFDSPASTAQRQNLNWAHDEIMRSRTGSGRRGSAQASPQAQAEAARASEAARKRAYEAMDEATRQQAEAEAARAAEREARRNAQPPPEEPAQEEPAAPQAAAPEAPAPEEEAAPAALPPGARPAATVQEPTGLSVPEERALREVNRRAEQARAAGQALEPDELARIYSEQLDAQQPQAEKPEEEMPERVSKQAPREPPTEPPAGAAPSAVRPPEALGPVESIGPGKGFFIRPEDADLEPGRFQFRRFGNRNIKDIEKWDEDAAGMLMVSRDPADNRLKVVNGHGRMEAARRLGAPRIQVFEDPWTDVNALKAKGAIQNMREGSADPVDAAVVLRQTGITEADLRKRGVPLSGKVAKDATGLLGLTEPIFHLVEKGEMPAALGAVIGRAGLSAPQQTELHGIIQKEAAKKKALTNDQVEEFVRLVKGAPTVDVSQETLFGTDTQEQSTALNKARISSYARTELRRQASTFKYVSKQGRAEQLEEAGVGTIDAEKAGALGTEAAQVLEVYDRLSTRAGPVADALNEAARLLQQGGNEKAIKYRALKAIRAAVQADLGEGKGPARGESPGVRPGDGESPPEEPGLGFGEESPRYGEAHPPEVADQVTARRVGMPEDLRQGVNLLAEERAHLKAIRTPGASVEIRGEGPESGVQGEVVRAAEPGGMTLVRVPATAVEPSAQADATYDRFYDEDRLWPVGGVMEQGRQYGTDLFGNEQPAEEKQGDLLGTGGPQGVSAALEQARATVSTLEGKIARGEASPTEQRRYAEANSLIRREEGRGLAGGEVRPAEGAAEPEGEKPLDLFGGLRQQMEFFPTPEPSPVQDDKLTYGSTAEAARARARTQAYKDVLRPEGRRAVLEREPQPWFDVRGHKIPRANNPRGMASAVRDLMAPFRNGKNEVHAFTLVDNSGTIKAFTTETSGAIDFVNLWRGDKGKTKVQVMAAIRRMVHEVAERARRSGATTVISSHNHPSGDPTASGADKAYSATIDKMFAEEGIAYAGSVVIDDTKANVILHDADGKTGVEEVDVSSPGDSPWLEGSSGNVAIRSPGDAAAEYRRLVPMPDDGAALLYLDTARRTVTVEPMRPERMANVEKWFGQKLREMGAKSAVMVVGPKAEALYDQAVERTNTHGLQTSEGPIFDPRLGGMLDVIQVGKGDWYRSAVGEKSIISVPREADDRPPRRPREEPGAYRAGDSSVRGEQPDLEGFGGEEGPPEEEVAGGKPPRGPRQPKIPGLEPPRPSPDDIKQVMRHTYGATPARKNDIVAAKLADFQEMLEPVAAKAAAGDQASRRQIMDLMDAMEGGPATIFKLPDEYRAQAVVLRNAWDALKTDLARTGGVQNFIDNYIGRIWDDPDQGIIAKIFGKRPLRGGRSFQKQRTYKLFSDGVKAGLTPIDWNPITMQLLKFAEAHKFIAAYDFKDELKRDGIIHFEGGKIPQDFARINDEAFTVYQKGPKGELIVRGHYVAPRDVADVINKYLAPSDLENIGLVKAIRFANNFANSIQLLGAFHLGFVGLDASFSSLALGMQHAVDMAVHVGKGNLPAAAGEATKAATQFAVTPLAPLRQLYRGNALLKAWRTQPGLLPKEMQEMMEAFEQGGMRGELDARYRTKLAKQFARALYSGTTLGKVKAAGLLPFAAIEKAMVPVLSYYVPRVKMAVFADMARYELDKLGPNASLAERRAALQRVQRTVDAREGQVIYDNLFWNKTVKLMLQLGFRSVGWQWGDFDMAARAVPEMAQLAGYRIIPKSSRRLLTNGAGEQTRSPAIEKISPRLGHNLAFMMAIALGTAAISGLYQLFRTGKKLESLKDAVYPRDGGTMPDGTESRVAAPSYARTYYGFATHPGATALHAMSPTMNALAELWQNEDFYGQQLYDPDASLAGKVGQGARHTAERELEPFSAQTFGQLTSGGEGFGAAIPSALGVTAAPASVRRTPFESFVADHYVETLPRGARTAEQMDRSKQTASQTTAIREALKLPPEERGAVLDQAGIAKMSDAQRNQILKRAQITVDEYRLQRLPLQTQIKAYEIATPEEREKNHLLAHIMPKAKTDQYGNSVPDANFNKRLAGITNADEHAAVIEELKKIREEQQEPALR